MKGRGSTSNPKNRFLETSYEQVPEWQSEEPGKLKTEFFRDRSKSIVTFNDSPDIPFEAGINPYRGCEHGCIYCYARPYHEYLGFSSGLDFESKILVKEDAPELLRKKLSSKSWKPQMLAMSGVTDCYQPIERKLEITRRCLKVLLEFRNPVGVITKNHLITRDVDVLAQLAKFECVRVFISVTTLRQELTKVMEPRTSAPRLRLEAIRILSEAGVPTGAMMAPVIPGLTDHEIPSLVQAVADAGAVSAGYTVLRLPYAVKDLFQEWLGEHFPDRKNKVLSRIRATRGGRLNDPNHGSRMRGEGIFAQQVDAMFRLAVRKAGLNRHRVGLTTRHFRNPMDPRLF